MIKYRSAFIDVGETFFQPSPPLPGVDMQFWNQLPAPLENSSATEFFTIQIDLRQNPSALLAGMNKDTRYEIRRAERENQIVFEVANGEAALPRFANCYDEFAREKGIPKIDRARLKALWSEGLLDVSLSSTADGEPLVWHSHCVASSRARLLHSASLRSGGSPERRKLISRANRLHHWLDMTRFRERGTAIYDLGGWYSGSADRYRLQINQFKEGFGGQIVRQFNCVKVLTLKGEVAYMMKQAFGLTRQMRGPLLTRRLPGQVRQESAK